MSRSACQGQSGNGVCEAVKYATVCLFPPWMTATSFCPSLVSANFRIKCPPPHTHTSPPNGSWDQPLPSTWPLSRGNSSNPILLPQSDWTFLGSPGHLSGDKNLCAHLIAQIISTLEHPLGQPAWDGHQGAWSTCPLHSLHVLGNKTHSLYPHRLDPWGGERQCPETPGKEGSNRGTTGHRDIGEPERQETLLQHVLSRSFSLKNPE